jgi:dethiobiotin synthetase
MERIIFVTGTDTGVGKTVLTALLVAFLREKGVRALGMKPFCSGSRNDARVLQACQEGCLTLDDVNPFYFDKPLAPGAAGRPVPLSAAVAKIRHLARQCDVLVVEGVGGLLVPLGRNYAVRDLIGRLKCQTIVVGANRLGTINHTLLTVESLQSVDGKCLAIVMMGVKKPDLSAASNTRIIRKMLPQATILSIPFLGFSLGNTSERKNSVIFLKKTLALLAGSANLVTFFSKTREVDRQNRLTTCLDRIILIEE